MKTFIDTFLKIFLVGMGIFIVIDIILTILRGGPGNLSGIEVILFGIPFMFLSFAVALIASIMERMDQKYRLPEEKKENERKNFYN